MPQISKRFRVAREGSTTDGRQITAEMIREAAETFNAETFAVRLNCEHIMGVSPNSDFGSYGDVTAVEAAEEEFNVGGKTQKRMALYATIAPLDNLLELSRKKQKLYTSIQVIPNWNETSKWGLGSIAITDNPASFSTEALEFSAKNHLYAGRKYSPDALFVEAEEVTFEFTNQDGSPANAESSVAGFFSALTAKLANMGKPAAPDAQPANNTPPATPPATPDASDPAAMFAAALTPIVETMKEGLTEMAKRQDAADAKFAALQEKLEKEPDQNRFTKRPAATGGKRDFVLY